LICPPQYLLFFPTRSSSDLSTGGATDQVSARDQSQAREGAGPDDPAGGTRAGRRSDRMTSRRAFLAGAATVLVTPLAARAQQPAKKLPRVTLVFSTTPVAEMLGRGPIRPDARGFGQPAPD